MKLELNQVYLNANNKRVRMVSEYTEADADYKQGYRFRGDDGHSYNEDGTVTGRVGTGVTLVQMGAMPLIGLAPVLIEAKPTSTKPHIEILPEGETISAPNNGLAIEVGGFYLNGLGVVVQIVKEVDPATNRYKSGYRFIDHQNTYYTQDGSVKSWLFGSLDLKSAIEPLTVTSTTSATIATQATSAAKIERVSKTADKVAKASAGTVVGLVIVQAASAALTGSFLS